jgi:hypothetical protein
MDKTKREVNIGRRELLDTLQIIHIIRQLHADKIDEVDDAEFLGSIIWTILDSLENTEDKCSVKLANEERFAVWLCLSQYQQFTTETKLKDEYEYVSNIITTFGGI